MRNPEPYFLTNLPCTSYNRNKQESTCLIAAGQHIVSLFS